MTSTYYSVQVMDEGFPRLVPHTGKKHCEFLNKKQAVEFLHKLKEKNPNDKFRILKKVEKYTPKPWI